MRNPLIWFWAAVTVAAPWLGLFADSTGSMRIVLGMLTFVGILNIVRTVVKPTMKQFWPAKTQQAVSGCSVGLLIGAAAALAMGFFADSTHTITIGAILLWTGAMFRAEALIILAKQEELEQQPADEPAVS